LFNIIFQDLKEDYFHIKYFICYPGNISHLIVCCYLRSCYFCFIATFC